MSLIIYKPAKVQFDLSCVPTIFEKNTSGFGFMFNSGGRVEHFKGVTEVSHVINIFNRTVENEVVYHFRSNVYNEKNEDNCQPFEILRKEENGIDLFMMQTGYINLAKKKENMSDASNFIEFYLRPLLIEKPNLSTDENFIQILKMWAGTYNKFVFMDSTGKTTILNKSGWTEFSGCLLSNDYDHKKYSYHSSYQSTIQDKQEQLAGLLDENRKYHGMDF